MGGEPYYQFRMKKRSFENLLHSYNHFASMMRAAGYPPTGCLPKFFGELHDILYKVNDKDKKIEEDKQAHG